MIDMEYFRTPSQIKKFFGRLNKFRDENTTLRAENEALKAKIEGLTRERTALHEWWTDLGRSALVLMKKVDECASPSDEMIYARRRLEGKFRSSPDMFNSILASARVKEGERKNAARKV